VKACLSGRVYQREEIIMIVQVVHNDAHLSKHEAFRGWLVKAFCIVFSYHIIAGFSPNF